MMIYFGKRVFFEQIYLYLQLNFMILSLFTIFYWLKYVYNEYMNIYENNVEYM